MKTLLTTLAILAGLVVAAILMWPGPYSESVSRTSSAASDAKPTAGLVSPARPKNTEPAASTPSTPAPGQPWSSPRLSAQDTPTPGSGLEGLPAELVSRIDHASSVPEINDTLTLELPGRARAEVRVSGDFRHPNGDISVHARGDGPTPASATLTWGRDGLFGRIQADQSLYLVHSDASGSWLVDLNDERIDVDNFHGDTLGQSLPAAVQSAITPSAQTHTRELLDDLARQSAGQAPSQIDVMFVYTPDMLERYPGSLIETRLNHLVAIANQAMVDSAVPIVVHLAHHQEIGYPAQQSNRATLQDMARALQGHNVPGMSGMKSAREAHGADIVALTWPHDIETRGSCGIAYFPRSDGNGGYDPSYGVHIDNDGVSNWSVCSDSVFTHELGHNLNAEHQRSSSSGDDPERDNYAFVRDGRFHTIMGSFGTGDINRYLRLDVFSNPEIRCGGEPCGSTESGSGADNAATLRQFGPIVAQYGGEQSAGQTERPDPSSPDSDGDGVNDWEDPYPFDPHAGQPPPDTGPATDFTPRNLRPDDQPDSHELLVVSSGTDQVLSFGLDGSPRGVVKPGPELTEYSDLQVDDEGRLYLLASGDVRRYDRLSGRLIDVFLGSTRPEPADLASAFPRAFARLPQDRFVVLGDSGIERFNALNGAPLGPAPGGEPTSDPTNWRNAMDLPLRGAASWRQTLYVAEAANNRIMAFALSTGQRRADLASPSTAPIEDPWALRMGPDGLLYLANGRASNILRFEPDGGGFVDEFVLSGAGGLDFARDLAFSPDGDLFVTSHAGNAVLRFDGQTGAFIETFVTSQDGGLDAPVALAFAPIIDELHAGHSGNFFVPERSGEGWLLEILDDQTASISWFTYPPEGSAREQAWMVGVGDIVGNRIIFEQLLETRAGPFGPEFDPEALELLDWGRLELDFSGCNSGVVDYQAHDPAWGNGRQRFTRLVEIQGLPCGAVPRGPSPEAPGISGQWYNPSFNGQGWFLEEFAPGQVFMAWFTYDDQGDQAWVVGEGDLNGDELIFDNLLMPTGSRFGDDFDAEAIERQHWGRLIMQFDDCERASVAYESALEEFGSGTMQANRLTSLKDLDCGLD